MVAPLSSGPNALRPTLLPMVSLIHFVTDTPPGARSRTLPKGVVAGLTRSELGPRQVFSNSFLLHVSSGIGARIRITYQSSPIFDVKYLGLQHRLFVNLSLFGAPSCQILTTTSTEIPSSPRFPKRSCLTILYRVPPSQTCRFTSSSVLSGVNGPSFIP